MTIALSANTPRVSYTVNQGASQTSFAVPFVFFTASTDLNVFVDNVARTFDASTSNTTQFTVSGGNGSTGSITTSVTGATGGSTVVITRAVPLSRTTDFPSSGAFEISKLNTELDTVTAIQSDFNDSASRAIRLQDSDSAVSMELPLLASRKGTVLGFNASTGAAEAGPTITAVQSLSAVTASINLLGTSAVVEDMGLLATSAVIEDMGLLATSSNVTAMGLLGVSSVITDMSTLGTSAVVEDMGLLGTSSNVTAMGNLGTSTVIGHMATLNGSGVISNISTVVSDIANVDTLASNVSGINDFAARYRVASSDPSSSLDVGDLYFDTTNNQLKVYKASGWIAASAFGNLSSDTSPELGGNLDVVTHSIVSASNRNIALTPNGSGVVRIDGSTGVDISQGAISIKNGGSQSYVRFYCESSNAHYAELTAPAHADFSGNISVVLPATAGTLALTSQLPTSGISSGNVATFGSGVADDDFLRVNGTTIEGRSASELASDIGAATTDDIVALSIALG